MLEFILDGLNCTSCAAKIEDHANRMDSVKSATVHFVNSSLLVEARESVDQQVLVQQIKDLVKRYEPDVTVWLKGEEPEGYQAGEIQCVGCEDENRPPEGREKKSLVSYLLSQHRLWAGIAAYALAIAFDQRLEYSLVLYLAAYFLIGYHVIYTAIRNIFRGEVFDENFLMVIATIGAFFLRENIEAVAVMLFYQVGEVFQDYAVDSSRKSIKDLVDLKASFANKLLDEDWVQVKPEALATGDRILVKPGEKVPVDGVIRSGRSLLDTAALTGESVPRELSVDDPVLGGYINTNASLQVEVTSTYEDSAVAKILHLIENASGKKSNTEKFITRFARYYTPAVVFMAAALSVIPPFVTGDPFSQWLQRGLIFLVISCPCALVISIPLGYFGGIGAASRAGILIKGSQYLEALKNMDTVVFDKTGTLTKGVFRVVKVTAAEGVDEEEVLRYGSIGESQSNHPIASSIRNKYPLEVLTQEIRSHEEIGGKGVRVQYRDQEILAGNRKLMEDHELEILTADDIGTVVHVALDGRYLGYILIADEIKNSAAGLMDALKNLGVKRTILLTGDHENIARHVADQLHMDEYRSELLPQDKVAVFETLKEEKKDKKTIGFVGDGINDAPVLAMADIGISMGSLGSDAAVEASDIVIMQDDPAKIADGIRIAKYTNKIVVQNIVFALGVKALVMGLGALGQANMWAAVFADVGVALIAVLNVSRIFYTSKKANKA